MKNLFLILLVFTLTSCHNDDSFNNPKVIEPVTETPKTLDISNNNWNGTIITSYFKDSIEYIVFDVNTTNGSGGRGVYVINHTKELLEIEKLKLEIKQLNNNLSK